MKLYPMDFEGSSIDQMMLFLEYIWVCVCVCVCVCVYKWKILTLLTEFNIWFS